jgi:hypothetical protein
MTANGKPRRLRLNSVFSIRNQDPADANIDFSSAVLVETAGRPLEKEREV